MTIKEIVKLACPTYKGRKILTPSTKPAPQLDSYWDEGYRSYYFFVRLEDKLVNQVHSNHPGFEPNQPRYLVNDLPKGWALVVHQFAWGKQYVVVYQGTGIDQYPVLTAIAVHGEEAVQGFYCPHCDAYYKAAEKTRMGICADCETKLQNREMGEDDE